MQIAIISNIEAGIGLRRDFELLRDFMQEQGHEVTGYQYDELLPKECPLYDLAIFLEVVPRNMLDLAPARWAFLNHEWCKPDVVKIVQNHIHKVFAKTHEAKRIFDPLFPGKVFYSGFLARDQYDTLISRGPTFLHVGGNSSLRGTQTVLDAWKWKKDGKALDANLVVISRAVREKPENPNVYIFEHVNEDILKMLQNGCKFHLYPSGTEGFGHAIHEAMSVDAIVVVPDAPPMNELDEVYQLPASKAGKYNLADIYEVSALDIYEVVNELLDWWKTKDVKKFDLLARSAFLAYNDEFEETFSGYLKELQQGKHSPAQRTHKSTPQIAFIGNFAAPESTENMIRWALEEGLGFDVELLQENEVNITAIRSAAKYSAALLWVRTPGWLRVPDHEMLEFLDTTDVATASIHLDKFWGIPEREKLIGVHPFWKTDCVFTADGSRQDDFKARGVNHIWMTPAVSEVYCHPGQAQDMYRCDVGFVGAKDYHGEYPFRRELVEFLEKTYEDRFKHITGLRGHGLNDFYASCKVVVGDCIFAGTQRYWSDRVPETCGRYGFLLHPEVECLDIPVNTYKAQDLEDLHHAIELHLALSDSARRTMARSAADHVRKYDTWTARMRSILDIIL